MTVCFNVDLFEFISHIFLNFLDELIYKFQEILEVFYITYLNMFCLLYFKNDVVAALAGGAKGHDGESLTPFR